MSAIDGREYSFRSGKSGEFFRRQDRSGERRDVAEEDDARARSDGIVEEIEHLRGILYRARQRNFSYHNAVALGLEVPWMLASGMFLISHQDFVAGLHVNAVRDVTVGFGGVAQQRDLVAVAAHKCGQRVAEFIPRDVSPDGVVFGILLIHLFGGVVAVKNGAEYRRRTGADGAVVEINLVFGNEELFAQFGPVGVVVLVEQRMIGEGRSFVELGKEISAEREGGGECGGSAEKAAAIEHWPLHSVRRMEGVIIRLAE